MFFHAVIIPRSAHVILQCSISKVSLIRALRTPGGHGTSMNFFSVEYYKLEHGTVGLTFPCYQSSLAPGQVTQHKGLVLLGGFHTSFDLLFSNLYCTHCTCSFLACTWYADFDSWMPRYVLLGKNLEAQEENKLILFCNDYCSSSN